MGTALLIIALIAAAHYCRLRRDNLAALGFAAVAILIAWPGFFAFAYDRLGELVSANGELLGDLLGAAIVLAAVAVGLRYIFSLRI